MNMKKWLKEEEKEHKTKICSKKWLKEEQKEGHKAPIGSKEWWKEEEKESTHLPKLKNYSRRYYYVKGIKKLKLIKRKT